MEENGDIDIDFDMDLDQSINQEKGENTTSFAHNVTENLAIINYRDEFLAERKQHELTKERLLIQEDEIFKLKTRIEKLEEADTAKLTVANEKKRQTISTPTTTESALQQRITDLEEELRFSLGAAEDIRALKSKSLELVERIRLEKLEKAKAEADVRSLSKKIDMLSSHIEKLMLHLKHEAASKLKAMDSLRGSEHRCIALGDKNNLLSRKLAVSDRCVHELREGSKILEDQLRLMDEKYLELRTKLDITRTQSAKKVERAEKQATKLRVKYALLGNSRLLDKEDDPMSESLDVSCDPATNMNAKGNSEVIHRGVMRRSKSAGVSIPKVKKMNMKPGFKHDDRDKQEEVVLDKIRRNRGRQTIWTQEKLRNLTKIPLQGGMIS